MLLQELRQLDTSRKALRKFGLLVGLVFFLLGAWCWYREAAATVYLLGVGVLLMALGLLFPAVLRTLYIAWMALGLSLGLVVSTVLLSLFFYLVITPVGLVARLFGNDFLERGQEPAKESYWVIREKRTKSAESYERQY